MTGGEGSPYGAKVYVLYGYWDTLEERDAAVIKASLGPGPVMEELDRIAQDKAGAYVEMYGEIQEERWEGGYEVMDASGRCARLYIVERIVEHEDGSNGDGLGPEKKERSRAVKNDRRRDTEGVCKYPKRKMIGSAISKL